MDVQKLYDFIDTFLDPDSADRIELAKLLTDPSISASETLWPNLTVYPRMLREMLESYGWASTGGFTVTTPDELSAVIGAQWRHKDFPNCMFDDRSAINAMLRKLTNDNSGFKLKKHQLLEQIEHLKKQNRTTSDWSKD